MQLLCALLFVNDSESLLYDLLSCCLNAMVSAKCKAAGSSKLSYYDHGI
jgi:hypothetical protein